MKKHVYAAGAMAALLMAACGGQRTTTSTTSTVDGGSLKNTSANMAAAPPRLQAKGPKPAWAPNIRENMLVVIEKLQSYNARPIETLTPEKARQQPTPTTAVMDVMRENGFAQPAPLVAKTDRTIPVNGAQLPVRIYTPNGATAKLPVIVYYHGGGWVIANLDVYDPSAQALAEKARAVVVSVHYRQGSEHKFPTAHNDAFSAYQWVVANAASLKGDPDNIAVAGESAGGNLACNVSIAARERGVKMPVAQVLVYPVANNDMNNRSYTQYADAKPLNKPMMMWFAKHYLNNMEEAADPRISLVKANLSGLPPTLIIAAEIDPLFTEGELLAERLKAAGVRTRYKAYNGVTHEFFGMGTVLPQAAEAQDLAVRFLLRRLD